MYKSLLLAGVLLVQSIAQVRAEDGEVITVSWKTIVCSKLDDLQVILAIMRSNEAAPQRHSCSLLQPGRKVVSLYRVGRWSRVSILPVDGDTRATPAWTQTHWLEGKYTYDP